MELSDEQKQRILEEEKQRLAEEQYREQVRKELLNPIVASGTLPASVHTVPGLNPKLKRRILFCAGGLVGVFGLALLIGNLQHSFLSTRHTEAVAAIPAEQAPIKLTTAQIAEKATPSVVVVENINENGQKAGQGSGYVYADDGTIITNYHVIRGAGALNVRLHSGASYRVDSIVGYDITHDVAILQVSGAPVSPLPTQDVELAKVGDKVVAIGAPLGLESTVSEGIISALRDMGETHIIQTTTSISPGSSGGPLLNEYGRVIGLTTSQMRDGQNLNFVMSARHITELLEQKRPIALSEMLTETQTTTPVAANTFMVPARNGWRITLNVPMQQGAVLEGSYEVRGGGGNDVDVVLTTNDNRVVLNSGRVSGSGEIKVPLPRGSYVLNFNNQFSTFTSKSVSPNLKLVYYR
jgi:S1-C subfamily serine protease